MAKKATSTNSIRVFTGKPKKKKPGIHSKKKSSNSKNSKFYKKKIEGKDNRKGAKLAPFFIHILRSTILL